MCKYFAEQIYLLREYWFSSCDYYGTNSFGWIHGEKKSRIKILWSGFRSPCLYGNLWCKHTFILLHCVREIGFSTLLYSSWNFFPNRSQFAYETDETTFFGIEIMSYKHFDVFFCNKHFDESVNLSECRVDIPFGKRSSYACHNGWPVAMYKIYHFIDVRRHEHVSSTSWMDCKLNEWFVYKINATIQNINVK